MQTKEEQKLVAGFVAGDHDCFRQLFEMYQGKIYTFCLGLIRRKDLAEEATADVFIQLWKRRSHVDPDRPVSALLHKIARDTAFNYLKKIASDQRLATAFAEQYPLITHRDGGQQLIAREQSQLIQQTIELLPPVRRRIFVLHYYQGVGNGMIADLLRISPHTVKSQLVKARHFLRERLAEAVWLLLVIGAQW